jgi:hypothetical protein
MEVWMKVSFLPIFKQISMASFAGFLAAQWSFKWQQMCFQFSVFKVQSKAWWIAWGSMVEFVLFFQFKQLNMDTWWVQVLHNLSLQTCFKWYFWAVPIGQMLEKCLYQKVKHWSNLHLNEKSQNMPFWLVKFWLMKFIFLERGDQMWLVGKNPTKIGQTVWEIWPFEVQDFLKSIRS